MMFVEATPHEDLARRYIEKVLKDTDLNITFIENQRDS